MARLIALVFAMATVCFFLAPALEVDAATGVPCGTVLIAGSSWLGGHGVDVKSNGTGWVGSCKGGSAGYGWQCVDLAYRLYASHGWGHIHAGGNGGAAYLPEGSTGVTFHANGTYRPVPGDLIIESATKTNPYGHVAVVDIVVGTTIHALEQNTQYPSGGKWVDHPRHDYTLSGLTITHGYGSVRGVLHAPKNTLSAAAPAPAPTPTPAATPKPTPTPTAAGIAGVLWTAAEQLAKAAAAQQHATPTPAPATPRPASPTFRLTDAVNLRAGPGTTYGIVGRLAAGAAIAIACQSTGTVVGGSRIWDKLATGGWVSDYYVNTPRFNAFTPGLATC